MAKKWLSKKEAMELLGLTGPQIRYKSEVSKKIKRRKQKGRVQYQIEVGDLKESEVSTSTPVFFNEDASGYHYDPSAEQYLFFNLPDQPPVVRVSRVKVESLIKDYSNETGGLTVNQIAGKYKLSRPSVQRILAYMGKTHDSSPFTSEKLQEYSEDDLVADLLRSKEQRVLVKAQQKRLTLSQRKLDDVYLVKEFINEVANRLNTVSLPKLSSKAIKHKRGNYTAVIGLTDLHIGKRGVDGFNSNVASTRALKTTHIAKERALEMWGVPDQWVITCGSDMLHVDNYRGTTERGTPMDTDTDPVSMLAIAYSTMETIVENLKQTASVKVVAISGNHDRLLSSALGMMLSARYTGEDSVEVIDGSLGSSYIRYGKTLLGFNHGDTIKHEKLPNIMAGERPKDWGECHGNWEWFTGHFHCLTLKVHEYNGCRVWVMPALSGTDRWHKLMGYNLNRNQLAMFKVEPDNGVSALELIQGKEK